MVWGLHERGAFIVRLGYWDISLLLQTYCGTPQWHRYSVGPRYLIFGVQGFGFRRFRVYILFEVFISIAEPSGFKEDS